MSAWTNFRDLLQYLAWIAMALTLCSTFSRTIIRLRLFAATSNILAIISSTAIGFWPSVIQNAVQLPLNIYRIREARRQVEKLRAAPVTGVHSGWLHPYARESTLFAGQVLFRKGDLGDRLYYLEAGPTCSMRSMSRSTLEHCSARLPFSPATAAGLKQRSQLPNAGFCP